MEHDAIDERPPRRRAVREWLAWAALLACVGLLSAWHVWYEREDIVRSERERLQEQAFIVTQNLVRQLGAVRSVLESVRTTIGNQDAASGRACQAAGLHTLRRAMPGVSAFVVAGRDGKILFADDRKHRGPLADGTLIKALKSVGSMRTMYLLAPSGDGQGTSEVGAAMAVRLPGGGANEVLIAMLDPGYFDVAMRSSLYGSDMASAVTDELGARLLFVPYNMDAPSQDRPGSMALYARHVNSGVAATVMQGRLGLDGELRLVAQRSVEAQALALDHRLVVSVSRSMEAVGRPWRRLAWEYGAVWAILALLGSSALYAQQRRRHWMEVLTRRRRDERRAAAERIELALGGANLGLWEWNLHSGRMAIDARGLAMLGHTSMESETVFDAWLEQIHPDDRRGVEQALASEAGTFDAEFRLRHRNGRWIWILGRGKVAQRDADGAPLRLAGTHLDVTERKEAEAEVVKLAFYDVLTGLPNRRLLLDRLGQSLAKSERNKRFGAVLFLDLDNFKNLNDTLGHQMGDRLLQRVAMRLQDATRETDTVARLGGDEFVILLEELGTSLCEARKHAEAVAAKIVSVLGVEHTIEGHGIHSTPSLGVALFDARTHSVDELLKQADMAMYEAKAAGRNAYHFFDPAIRDNLDRGAILESELRHALAARQLVLYHQPVIAQDGCMLGTEALVRWQHPQRGLIAPGDFIAQAEKSDLIIDIGNYILECACEQLVAWSTDPVMARWTVAVNISARQAHKGDFVTHIKEVIVRTGANPARLKLELTESMLLRNVDDMIGKMQALKELGVRFALDDFGTGYSSLSYLERLPISQLKIDRSFVSDMLVTPNAAAIVRTIIILAHNLGLEVTAEGVETQEQWTALLDAGCDNLQGFLFSPPLPVSALARWVATRKCGTLASEEA
jgi:diguanylate cyclase (GGDEF)-like protein/PAS domain S-box-containing protein